MKKNLILTFIIVILITGCSNSIEKSNNEIYINDYKLPNGKILSNFELNLLKDLNDTYNFDKARLCNQHDEIIIGKMINTLEAEFGNKAKDYYGDIVISRKIIPITNNSRSVQVNMWDDAKIAWVEIELIKHWGPWWCYMEFTSYIKCRDKNFGGERKLYVDSAICKYKDSATDSFVETFDWTYLDDPSNYTSGYYDEIEWEVKFSHAGIVNVTGDTEYGFFPSISDVYCDVTFYDPLIVGEEFSYIYTW